MFIPNEEDFRSVGSVSWFNVLFDSDQFEEDVFKDEYGDEPYFKLL